MSAPIVGTSSPIRGKSDMKPEVWYRWYEYFPPEEHGALTNTCYITPRGDPQLYEYPIDFIFQSEEDAVAFIVDHEIEPEEYEDWVLVKETMEPMIKGDLLMSILKTQEGD